jgi:tRNA (guanine-N7-)-methyltransferase
MPLQHFDPFTEISERMNKDVNPYVLKLSSAAIEGTLPVKYGPLLKGLSGQWREQFLRENPTPKVPLILEIGCHLGDTLTALGSHFRESLFVGLDITFKRVVTAAERAHNLGLNNVMAVYANAKTLDLLFVDQELDGVILFFPDPWEKKKSQHHNRLLNPEYCALLSKKVKKGGFFWLKTDSQNYFENAAISLSTSGWKEVTEKPDLCKFEVKTKFQKKFELEGKTNFESVWIQ